MGPASKSRYQCKWEFYSQFSAVDITLGASHWMPYLSNRGSLLLSLRAPHSQVPEDGWKSFIQGLYWILLARQLLPSWKMWPRLWSLEKGFYKQHYQRYHSSWFPESAPTHIFKLWWANPWDIGPKPHRGNPPSMWILGSMSRTLISAEHTWANTINWGIACAAEVSSCSVVEMYSEVAWQSLWQFGSVFGLLSLSFNSVFGATVQAVAWRLSATILGMAPLQIVN